MTNFVGSWKMDHTHNFDAVLHKLGINVIKRKLIESTKPVITFKLDGNKMTMRTVSALKTTTISFTFDEEFDEETADGRKVKTKFTKESDSRITQVQTDSDNVTHTVREINGDIMTTTATVGDVTAVNTYHKVDH
ncbi:Fatty acid-binding protein type 3 [Fasciolopsis buskii]|uniref:Fatty acid-binding protein type 3 n=1 Tax=Fasciolopsis buskii TaxID=27845 RepID=A0A8E0S762_9TREM|nr:Fatty acid-binding protein type 3 [Fasciolopsis buski]